MKRLVYAPKVNAYIKADSGIYDISDYITNFNVTRKINQVSTAELTFRNPGKMWTQRHYTDPITKEQMIGPVFHPMDPITIILTRLQNRPVQVFTGYCDSTPYLQLHPGTVSLTASCTLKKLLYTYFDSGLPFFNEFLIDNNWLPNKLLGGVSSPTAEQPHSEVANKDKGVRYDDSGIGQLLYNVLHVIGGWDDSTIYIEELPSSVIEVVAQLFDVFKKDREESSEELETFLHQIIGSAPLGGGGPGEGPEPAGTTGWVRVGATEEGIGNPEHAHAGGMAFAELLTAGANRSLKSEALYRVLGIPEDPSYPYGMPIGTAIQIRMPGSNKAYTMYKNDVGSGQEGDPHYKVDLQFGIMKALGWTPNQDVEVRKIIAPGEEKHHPKQNPNG